MIPSNTTCEKCGLPLFVPDATVFRSSGSRYNRGMVHASGYARCVISRSASAEGQRARRMDPERNEQINKHRATYNRKKRVNKILAAGNQRADAYRGAGFLKTVERHISRGRDAGDIAMREGVPVSRVLQAIQQVQNSAYTSPQPTQQSAQLGKP